MRTGQRVERLQSVSIFDEVQAAVEAIRGRSKLEPVIGVVLGSGLGAFADRVADATAIPYRDLPHYPQSGVAGHKGELVLGTIDGTPCAIMSGRVHYYEGYEMDRVTFPTRVLAGLGVSKLLITNAAGAIDASYKPGDFMVITDHINLTGQNPLRGTNDERLGPRFPDMSHAYSLRGQKLLHEAAADLNLTLHEGVYVGLAGPSYETPAEIRMMRTVGADAVGMSTVAEVIVASHAGLEVAGMSVITNRAAGLSDQPLSHDEVKEVGAKVQGVFCDLLACAVGKLA